ncbi:DUF3237 family protein [Nocardia jinanensis]|nr:DUF3237 family protein [Nocardia jinanensis]
MPAVPGFLDGRTMIMAGDAEQKFVAYPIGDAINFIAERRTGGFHSGEADWNRAVDPSDYYFRLVVQLETSRADLAELLERSLFVASAIRQADRVRYTAYRVT